MVRRLDLLPLLLVLTVSAAAVGQPDEQSPSDELGFKSVWFIHMRKAAGTSFRDYARRLALLRPLECGGVDSWRRNRRVRHSHWPCSNISFHHVEFSCFAGRALSAARHEAMAVAAASLSLSTAGSHTRARPPWPSDAALFEQPRHAVPTVRLVTVLRHPVHRLISLFWYAANSPGVRLSAELVRVHGEATGAANSSALESSVLRTTTSLQPPRGLGANKRAQFANFARAKLVARGNEVSGCGLQKLTLATFLVPPPARIRSRKLLVAYFKLRPCTTGRLTRARNFDSVLLRKLRTRTRFYEPAALSVLRLYRGYALPTVPTQTEGV